MTRISRYFKVYIGPFLLAILLLFGQAMCDLSLPNYMSQIVNVGIQQGGIEDAVPNAVSAKDLQLFRRFMTNAQKKQIDQNYQIVPKGSNSKTYPLNQTEDVYTLKSDADRTAVNNIFGETTWTFINTMKTLQKQMGSKAPSPSGSSKTDLTKIDFSKLYQMEPMLSRIPQQAFADAQKKAAAMQNSMKLQSGVVLVQSFYKELGLNTGAIERNYIILEGLKMLALTLASVVAAILVSLLAARISSGLGRDLHRDVFHRVNCFSNTEFDKFSTASLITRTTNDITQVQLVVMIGIRMLVYSPIMAIGGITMAVRKSVSMTWIIVLAVIVLVGLVAVLFSIAMPHFKKMQVLIDRLNLVARENLTGLMVTRAFSNQSFEENRFDQANTDLTENQRFVNRLMTIMMPAMMLIMNGVSLLVVWVGAHQVANSSMQVGDMMAYMQYAMQIIISFLFLSSIFIFVPRASVSAGRIADVLETQPTIVDPQQPKAFHSDKKGLVEFKNVCFRYKGAEEDVLHDITFTARPGKTTAFIGSTGSGKSTLVNMVPRFYDVTSGSVQVDGCDVREVTQKDLHARIGYVPQKGQLLSGTIASNLRYGKSDATDDEIRTAAQVAQATEFIDSKPEGMETPIAEGGGNVSGGQKQRLSIARALATQAEIYVFDDSFSALDFKTDALLRAALKKHSGDATVLLVAQRVSTIMDADQIIVLDDGKIVGCGTHEQLLKNCPTYYEIASSQLTKEELA
ncbi:MAG: ABC transporter ATP-binding protein [Oscillospiraceae bacterium]|nr:ABC transporter ATP-binding protein [Oscillospiraceae bacterium]